jgi:cytochrome c
MRLAFLLSLPMAVAISGAVLAADHASLDEAKAMAAKAAAHYRQAGAAQALDDFQKSPAWRDRDLYVFAANKDAVMLVNAASPALIGKNLATFKDVDGKLFLQEMIATKEQAWVDYKWRNPQSNAVEQKTSYVIRVDDATILGVGAYKN